MGDPTRRKRTMRQRWRTLRIRIGRLWSRAPGQTRVIVGFAITALVGSLVAVAIAKAQSALADDYRITVETNPDRISTRSGPIGGSYVVSTPIQDIGEPPNRQNNCIGRYEWAHSIGGIDADSTTARVTIDGLTEKTVHIDGISASVIESTSPSVGSNLTCPGRGEQPNIRSVLIDLDTNPPAIFTTDASGKATPFAFTVSKGQSEIINISATTNRCTCSWQATLSLSVDGEVQFYTVQAPGGKPFRTTASINAMWYQFIGGRWVEQRSGPDPAEPTPSPNEIPGPIADICDLATPHADSALQRKFSTQHDSESVRPGPGGNLLRHNGCTFVVDAQAPTATPTGKMLVDSMTVWLDGAKTDQLAKAEFDAFVKGYSLNGPGQSLPEIAQDAILFDGVFIARSGRLLLTVQISATSKDVQSRTRTVGEALLKELPT